MNAIQLKQRQAHPVKCMPLFAGWRFWGVSSLLLLALLLLLVRSAWLQIVMPAPLVQASDQRSLRIESVPSVRGMITDRTGRPLAVSVPAGAVWADAQALQNLGSLHACKRWQALAEVLAVPLATLTARIEANPKGRFIYLARQVTPTVAQYIRQLAIPGVYLNIESRRFYPAGEMAAHIIGFTNVDSIGIEGVEKSANELLSGQPGQRRVRKDGIGRVIEDQSAIDAGQAQNLILSIDERLQSLAYRALKAAVREHKAASGSVVLLDVHSGEILALVNSPSYNPNKRAQASAEQFRNRAITDTFEPGSTVKPLVLLKALQSHTVKGDSVIDTAPGALRLNGHLIRDIRNYGPLTLAGVLQKSSNVAVSKLSLAIPIQDLITLYRDFGLAVTTEVGLVGESSGYMLNKRRWSDLERATFAFGYGLAVTPLQLARAYATLGSLGVARPLSMLRVDSFVPGERVAPEALVRQVLQMMEQVESPNGRGAYAAVPGYRVSVKTGTTRIVQEGGYSHRNHISYTAGVAPTSDPRLALVVVINNPMNGQYYGSTVAAPLFAKVMGHALRILDIQPDAPSIAEGQWANNRCIQ